MRSSAVHASRVRLELFDHPEDATAARVIDLDPARNRTGDVWHVWVEGIRSRSTLCLPRGWPLRTQRRTSFQFQQASPRPLCDRDFAAAPVGFCIGAWIRPVGAGARLGLSRSWTMPGRCRNAYLSTSPSTGMETGHPGIRGRRRSFMKRMFAALPFIPSRAWTIREPTEA